MLDLQFYVIVVTVEHGVLLQFSLSRVCEVANQLNSRTANELAERQMASDVNRQSSRHHNFTGGKQDT
jgi:hypothetical protein